MLNNEEKPNFKFSLGQLTVLITTPLEIADMAAECGYDCVSIRQMYMNLPEEEQYPLNENPQMLKDFKSIIRSSGLEVLDVELARIFDGVNIKDYEPKFELAREIGAKHILSSIWTENKPYYIEKFNELCEMGKKYGLTVDLEYVPVAGVKNLKQSMEVIESVDFDNVGLMLDTHHVHRAKDLPEDIAKVPDKYFHYAQVCDAIGKIPTDFEEMRKIMREGRMYPGEGGIYIDKILNSMPIVPYSIELPNNKYSLKYGYKEHAKKCLETAKDYCNKFITGRSEVVE